MIRSSLIAPQEVLPIQKKPFKAGNELTQEEKKKKRKLKKNKFKETKKDIQKKYGKTEKELEKEIVQERVKKLYHFILFSFFG